MLLLQHVRKNHTNSEDDSVLGTTLFTKLPQGLVVVHDEQQIGRKQSRQERPFVVFQRSRAAAGLFITSRRGEGKLIRLGTGQLIRVILVVLRSVPRRLVLLRGRDRRGLLKLLRRRGLSDGAGTRRTQDQRRRIVELLSRRGIGHLVYVLGCCF